MRGWMLIAWLAAAPAFGHPTRADRCGCHSQFGMRHCHTGKKTPKCEAPVKAVSPEKARAKTPRPVPVKL